MTCCSGVPAVWAYDLEGLIGSRSPIVEYDFRQYLYVSQSRAKSTREQVFPFATTAMIVHMIEAVYDCKQRE